MQIQPVVVALHSLYKLFLFLCLSVSIAQASPYINPADLEQLEAQKYIAKIELNTGKELSALLLRAQQWSKEKKKTDKPIAFVLHGEEAALLLRSNYQSNMSVVDLAKQLDEDEVIDIQVCKTWMFFKGYGEEDFAEFVKAVPYAPSEINRLISKEGYTYF